MTLRTSVFYTLTVVFILGTANGLAADPPTGWSCPSAYYDDAAGECDCGCGVVDIDCAGNQAPFCDNDRCDNLSYPGWADNSTCIRFGDDTDLPDGWGCSSTSYDDNACDCGCGARDFDCNSLYATACDWDNCSIGEYPGYSDNTVCIEVGQDTDLPAGWTCGSFYYNNGRCECGCNATDDDCTDLSLSSCESIMCYDEDESDDVLYFPGFADNTQCYGVGEDPALPGWQCEPDLMADNYCDCGCGAADSDCTVSAATVCDESHCGTNEAVSESNNALCVPLNGDTDTQIVDTATETDTSVDTGSVIDTDTEVVDTARDTDTHTVDTAVDTQSADTDSGTQTDTETTNTVDTDSETHNADTSTDTGPVIVPRDLSTDDEDTDSVKPIKKKSSGGCSMSIAPPAHSLFDLLF